MIYAIYDLEIIKAIPPKNEADRLLDIEYCDGWTDYKKMGISVGAYCLLDTETWETSEPTAYLFDRAFNCTDTPTPESLKEMARYTAQELVGEISQYQYGGFNSKKFDDNLLSEVLQIPDSVRSNFDILEMVINAAGDTDVAYWDEGRSYSLAKIAQANGYQKTLSGELAPIEWQRANHQLVIDYCKNDALIEAETLKRLLQGSLIDPNTGKTLRHRGI
jgi:hypothetical protein